MSDAAELQRIFTSASLGLTAYRSWAQQARRERRINIARLFDALAAVKMARAEASFRRMGETGTSARNVERALSGLEPESIATGPVTATSQVARELLTRAQHALTEQRDLRADEMGDLFVCSNCGNLHEGPTALTCPVCGTVAEAHKSFRAIDAMGTMGPHGIMHHLERTEEALRKFATNIEEGLLEKQLKTSEPSFKEILGHLVDMDAVFRERAWLILETDQPELPPAHPPKLDAAARYRDQPVASILDAYHNSRKQTITLLRGLTSAAWHRNGHHEVYGAIDLLHQGNWFVQHERTHIVELAQMRHDLLTTVPHNAEAELHTPLVTDASQGE